MSKPAFRAVQVLSGGLLLLFIGVFALGIGGTTVDDVSELLRQLNSAGAVGMGLGVVLLTAIAYPLGFVLSSLSFELFNALGRQDQNEAVERGLPGELKAQLSDAYELMPNLPDQYRFQTTLGLIKAHLHALHPEVGENIRSRYDHDLAVFRIYSLTLGLGAVLILASGVLGRGAFWTSWWDPLLWASLTAVLSYACGRLYLQRRISEGKIYLNRFLLLSGKGMLPPTGENPTAVPFRFPSNQPFVRSAGGFEYLAAERATVTVAGAGSADWHLMCQIQFLKNGSLFVQFPYFKESAGVLADPVFEDAGEGTSQIRLNERGRATSHLVKYHHPPDGNAHFSQDGKIRADVRRQSFPLTASGHLWELHAFGLKGFQVATAARVRRKRAYLPFYFQNGLPERLTLSGDWWQKDEIAEALISAEGPWVRLPRRSDGVPFKALLLGQPDRFKPNTHVLALNVAVPPPIGSSRVSMIFMGGWDSPDTGAKGPGTGCLAFMYPVEDFEELARRIGSVDYSAGGDDE